MSDVAAELLLQCWRSEPPVAGQTLWVADEQLRDVLPALAGVANLEVLSNRVDVVRVAQAAGVAARFSDFDGSPWPDGSLERVYYRVSKEKAVVHHVINEARRMLAPGGQLVFAGYKQEGTRTYFDKARTLFGSGEWQKNGVAYLARCVQPAVPSAAPPLDSQHYPTLRQMEADGLVFWTKPGLFGWNKIDLGSAFLAAHLPAWRAAEPTPPQRLLDLGCGYGYLLAVTRDWPLARRVATDNNAAAIAATTATAQALGLDVEVVADDFGSSLQEHFDVILCNPPFHQGFRVEDRLTTACLRQAARLLSPQGTALFVVNAFIPLEQAAQPFFRHIETWAQNGSFKLVRLRQPVH